MSHTYITSKSYNEVKENGKTVDKRMFSATYDGKRAVIDKFNNNRAYRHEFTESDIENINNRRSTRKQSRRANKKRRTRGRKRSSLKKKQKAKNKKQK